MMHVFVLQCIDVLPHQSGGVVLAVIPWARKVLRAFSGWHDLRVGPFWLLVELSAEGVLQVALGGVFEV